MKHDTRSQILATLRSAGDWISSALLTEPAGISRAAVSKHIAHLRQQGYIIETSPKRGYHFVSAPDLMLPEETLPLCKSRFVPPETYHHFDCVDSTNLTAREMADKGAPEGTLVIAESQKAGRGRKGRDWVSPEKTGIYASLVLSPSFALEDAPLLTLLAAVVTASAIDRLCPELNPAIKWPNDLLINGRKVAGVLTEVSSEIDRVTYAIIGIGINVNTPRAKLPRRPIFPATSLSNECHHEVSRSHLLAHWLDAFAAEYASLRRGGRARLLQRWKAYADIIGRRVKIRRVNDTLHGTVLDINRDGALLLKTASGGITTILSGDISYA